MRNVSHNILVILPLRDIHYVYVVLDSLSIASVNHKFVYSAQENVEISVLVIINRWKRVCYRGKQVFWGGAYCLYRDTSFTNNIGSEYSSVSWIFFCQLFPKGISPIVHDPAKHGVQYLGTPSIADWMVRSSPQSEYLYLKINDWRKIHVYYIHVISCKYSFENRYFWIFWCNLTSVVRE